MKLSTWAKKNGLHYRSAWRLFKEGQLPNAWQLPSGTILVDEKAEPVSAEFTVVYARVSSSMNKPNLETQADRVCQFCSAKGWVVNQVVKECASGLNDHRPKLSAILGNPQVTRIVVEHKDRLTRFGFNYLKLLSKAEIVVINEVSENEADLMQDFISLVTCFSARLYGRRRSRRNTEKLIQSLRSVEDPQ